MKRQALEADGTSLGWQFEDNHALFVFGNRHLTRDRLPDHFPHFEFSYLRQVHGRKIVSADPEVNLEADGHFTRVRKQALVVQTADCVPVLLSSPRQVCALHAGWRGVAHNIVAAATQVFASDDPPRAAIIGPHIHRAHFEVGTDVARQLLLAAPPGQDQSLFVWGHRQSDKIFFDLNALVRAQLEATFQNIAIFDCKENTFALPVYHSFRRDREQAGRQYSFVVLKA
ncbi:MAG: polyphenol oxidase family protein [Bdellovibrionales bacterium]